jgi:hypothetical protein
LLAVEIFVGFQTGIVGVAELSGLLVGDGVAGLRPSAASRVLV